MAEVETVMHGTTLITNATIERRGAVTGFLVTRGFRDVLDIGKEQRYDLFDLRIRFPDPLVPRPLRREVSERIQFDGTVETPLDDEEVRRAVAELVERARDRGAGGRPLALLRQPRTRASDPAAGFAGIPIASPVDFVGRLPVHARVRALDDDDRQRLHAAHGGPLSGGSRERAQDARISAASSTS